MPIERAQRQAREVGRALRCRSAHWPPRPRARPRRCRAGAAAASTARRAAPPARASLQAAAASAKSPGALPTSTAIACSSARAWRAPTPDRRARRRQLRLRLQHVGLRRDAGVVAVLRDLQRALVAFDACAQQLDLAVGLAQREVVGRELALRRQPRRGEIGLARLRAGARALDRARRRGPRGRAPSRRERRRERVGGAGAAGRAVAAAGARCHWRRARPSGSSAARCSRTSAWACAYAATAAATFWFDTSTCAGEAFSVGVAEQRPPVAAIERVGRRGRQPVAPAASVGASL